MDRLLNFLIIEDNPADVERIEAELRLTGLHYSLKQVSTFQAFQREVEMEDPDLVICEYRLAGIDRNRLK